MDILSVPNINLMYASSFQTLEDIARTEACKGKYVHCAFPFKTYKQMKNPLERELKKMGCSGLWFSGEGLIELRG
ncbi:hypothetical protein [Vibrio sp. R78045]|uniref:hypothetical protein n=1 Tax=Vibrio sp. R78045 TaxID=3093868 RepID=UPI0036F400C4